MNKWKLFILFIFLGVAVSAQSDLQQVTDRQAEFNATLMHPDSLLFDKLVSDSLSYGHSAWKIQTKQEFLKDILHGVAAFSNLSTASQTISVAGNNAIVRQVLQGDLTSSGQLTKVKLGILLVWTKEDGQWKLLARQAVKIP